MKLSLALAASMVVALVNSTAATDKAFVVGQVWSYRGADPASSRVVIGAIEKDPGDYPGGVVSVAIIGALLPVLGSSSTRINTIVHAPMTGESLAASVLNLESTGKVPADFDETAYNEWRNEFYSGDDVGVFTLEVRDIVRMFWDAAESGAGKN